MKQSLRARHMARHHRRLKQGSKLNLVALMDIFTILVFFLLVNTSDVQVLQTDKSIKLPASVADKVPEEQLIIMVSTSDVILAGQRIASVAEVLASTDEGFGPLEAELNYQASRARVLSDAEQAQGRAITIMGDQSIPYALLKKIMTACAASDYRDISLAVSHKNGDEAPVVN